MSSGFSGMLVSSRSTAGSGVMAMPWSCAACCSAKSSSSRARDSGVSSARSASRLARSLATMTPSTVRARKLPSRAPSVCG
nr:MAG: hypothetical protein [Molluscum contagiosum virus]